MSKALAIKLAKALGAPIPAKATPRQWKELAQEYAQEKRQNEMVNAFKHEKERILYKAKAIKLAKALGAPIPKDVNWKELYEEYAQEKHHNEMVDAFKLEKDKLFHKRKMRNVIQALKQPEARRIEIPVEATEPPTVTRQVVDAEIRGINLADYTIAFTVTVMKQYLDESGDLEREQEETSPEAPIRSLQKMKPGALVGFLNNYMKKLSKSLTWVKSITLVLTKKVNQPKRLPPLKEAMNTNCLIDIVREKLSGRANYIKKLKSKLEELDKKYFEQGCTEKAIDEICHAMQINIHIVSILQETWYHYHLGDTKKTLLICAHNKHATYLEDWVNMADCLDIDKPKKVHYVNAGEHFLVDTNPITFPIVIKGQIVAYYSGENLYKNRDIFFDKKDWKKNQTNKDLQNVFTLTSRYYHDLKRKYDLQDKYYNKDLYDFVKCAEQYAPSWQTDPDYHTRGFAMDQTRAYMCYEKSPYYEHYQFPRMPTHFYECTTQDEQDKILDVTGFAEVTDVEIPITKETKFLRETKFIQNGGVYTTMRLKWLHERGVTFKITKVAWSNDKQKLDFHIRLTEWQQNAGFQEKQEENALMGRLIPNQNTCPTSLVHCKDDLEFLQLRYQLGDRVLNVDFDKKIVTYTVDKQQQLKGAYHVHAYILDYQQITFASRACSVPFSQILKVKVDCIVLSNATFDKCDNATFDEWPGFHPERTIKDVKTPSLAETDFTHRKFVSAIKLASMPHVAFHKYNELTGAAGCAKTYTATHWNLWDACILVPTNGLRVKFAKENPDIPCSTYHKEFQTNKKKGDYLEPRRPYANYILDESSMICKGVMDNILTHKNAMNANIVLIHDRAQLAPVMPGNETWERPQDRYFTNGEEYKKRRWNLIHLTKQMRQSDPAFIEILEKMRQLHDTKNFGLKEMIELLKDRIITSKQCLDLYRMDKEDLLIASTNAEVDRWNEKLLKRATLQTWKYGFVPLKLQYNKSGRTYVNNERVIMQEMQTQNQDLSFASTVHVVQGLTFPDRMFISLSLTQKNNNFDNHLLYTAVSRVKSLDQLYLVEI